MEILLTSNFVLRSFLESWNRERYRVFFLSSHYGFTVKMSSQMHMIANNLNSPFEDLFMFIASILFELEFRLEEELSPRKG